MSWNVLERAFYPELILVHSTTYLRCVDFSPNRYVALEDFENGIKSYQSALQVDERHYNSWYGLGVLYLRQEKFEFAEHHFRRALHINPRSSVLMCYLGMALHALKVYLVAL